MVHLVDEDIRVFTAERFRPSERVLVDRVMPQDAIDQLDPFILIDDLFLDGKDGFPMHAHMGFEKYTFVVEGALHHQDDLGNDFVAKSGSIHWLMAGAGVMHAETPLFGTRCRAIQVWLNLPSVAKEKVARVEWNSESELNNQLESWGSVQFLVGTRATIGHENDVHIQDVHLNRDTSWPIPPCHVRQIIYVLAGQGRIDGQPVKEKQMIVLPASRLRRTVDTSHALRLLWMYGQPTGVPAQISGGFVD